MRAHTAVSCGAIRCLMGQFEAAVQDKIGLPEGVHVIGYRSL